MLKSINGRINALILLSVFICGTIFSIAIYTAHTQVHRAIVQQSIDDVFVGVRQNIRFFDQLLLTREVEWDRIFHENLPKLTAEIQNTFKDPINIPPRDLRRIAESFGFSSLYIVDEDLVVRATSYTPELGLDLKKFSPEYTAYLRELQNEERVGVDRVSASTATGKLKKYGYFSPADSSLIFNTDINVLDALRSPASYNLRNFLFRDFAKNIRDEHHLVATFDLFIVTEADRWSMLNEGQTLTDSIARYLYGPATVLNDWAQTRTIYREVEMPFHDNPGVIFVAKVTFDDSVLSLNTANDILVWLTGGLVVGIGVAFWLSHRTLGRGITTQAQRIADTLIELKTDSTARVRVQGTDELSEAGTALNELADTLAERERALTETNRTLEHQVVERTTALQDARIAAEESNKAKSDFLMSMSHELRTPLNAIIGYSNMISRPQDHNLSKEKALDAAATIEAAGTHLLALVNSVLDLSKIEAGEYSLDIRFNQLRDVIDDVVDMMQPMIKQRDLDVTMDVPPDLPALSFDNVAVKRVLVNLLSNAIKFSPVGGNLSLAASSDDTLVTISITDEGEGMTESEINMALEVFGQVTNNPMLAKQGAGLGLPISRMLVELHGGTLWITSTPGDGTCVTFTLPMRDTTDAAAST